MCGYIDFRYVGHGSSKASRKTFRKAIRKATRKAIRKNHMMQRVCGTVVHGGAQVTEISIHIFFPREKRLQGISDVTARA